MRRFVVLAARALAVSAVVLGAIACQYAAPDGESCLKDSDCQSNTCIYGTCVDVTAGKAPLVDSGVAASEAAVDATGDGSSSDATSTSSGDGASGG
jgi:hypothetical protein